MNLIGVGGGAIFANTNKVPTITPISYGEIKSGNEVGTVGNVPGNAACRQLFVRQQP